MAQGDQGVPLKTRDMDNKKMDTFKDTLSSPVALESLCVDRFLFHPHAALTGSPAESPLSPFGPIRPGRPCTGRQI